MSYVLDFVIDSPDSVHKIPLEGVLYNIRFRWNTFSEAWHCYFGPAGSEYVLQFKLRVGVDLFNGYHATKGVPRGIMMMFDAEKGYGRASIDNIGKGKRFQFIYFDSTEL